MSGCHPDIETLQVCKHGRPLKFGCTICYGESYVHPILEKPIKECEDAIRQYKSMTEKEENSSPMVKKIQDLEEKVKEIDYSYVSPHMIFQLRQEIEAWQRGCEIQINVLMKCNRDLEERIDNLKKDYVHLHHFGSPVFVESIKILEERINKLEKERDIVDGELRQISDWMLDKQEKIRHIEQKIEKLEKTVSELVDKIAEIANFYYKEKKMPHVCPVCDGTTFCEAGSICIPCEGKGIVWN